MLKQLLDSERQYLNYFFDNFDVEAAEQMLRLFQECKGVLLFTGIGKSGLVAEKIAVTMTSTGTRALFISPTNALHGDIGFVTDKDIFIAISKSGESEELLNLIPYIRNKGAKVVAIASNPTSRLVKASDISINLPVKKELCPFDMAPTTSTVVQMLFGDMIAVALMNHHKFSLDQWMLNHPAGRIGKRLSLKVRDLMITGKEIPVSKPHHKLVDSLVELSNKRCGCVLVVNDDDKLEGIFTDGDLRRALQNNGPQALDLPLEQLMTKPPRTIHSDALAWKAVQVMEDDQKHPITVLAVVHPDNQKLEGIIKMHDIVQSGI